VDLQSTGQKKERMALYDGNPGAEGERTSGAEIVGKTPYANAYGPIFTGKRSHRALVFDGSHMHYYINGNWQGKRHAEAPKGMMWKMQELYLGCRGDDEKFFRGQIDQVRISRVVRYTDNFAPVTSVASDELTRALYNFDEGQGDVLKDASGHGHHGRIYGATWGKESGVPQSSGDASSPSEL
jgi:hypothetical protein